jgi:hypothetical protein
MRGFLPFGFNNFSSKRSPMVFQIASIVFHALLFSFARAQADGHLFFFARARMHAFERHTIRIQNLLVFLALVISLPAASHALDKKLQKAASQISNPSYDVCLPAIELLGRSKNIEAVPPLAKAYPKENRPLVRRYLIDALGLLGSRDSQPVLAQALNDSDEQVRQNAVVALSRYPDAASQQLLVNRADTEMSPAVKSHLVQALGRSQHPAAKSKYAEMSKKAKKTKK